MSGVQRVRLVEHEKRKSQEPKKPKNDIELVEAPRPSQQQGKSSVASVQSVLNKHRPPIINIPTTTQEFLIETPSSSPSPKSSDVEIEEFHSAEVVVTRKRKLSVKH